VTSPGREVNLLDRYPAATRNLQVTRGASAEARTAALKFDVEYFDGDRATGYGGYRYDGRWLPVAERIRDHYGLRGGDRVLDVGCAKGFFLHDLRTVVPGIEVFGLEISGYAIAHAMPEVRRRIVRGTAQHLPFADRSFDAVIAINVLHNLDQDGCIEGLREIERVARGGRYVQVDSWLNEEQRENFERWVLTAKTYMAPEGWRRLFASAGYRGDYYWTIAA
jgi:SAM-dependent methyltransferase